MDKEKAYKTIAKHIYIVTDIKTNLKYLILADDDKEANEKAKQICKLYSIKTIRNEHTEDVQIYRI